MLTVFLVLHLFLPVCIGVGMNAYSIITYWTHRERENV